LNRCAGDPVDENYPISNGEIVSNEEFQDIDLAQLSDDDLVAQMHDDLYDGLGPEIIEGTTILLDRGWSATKVLETALVEGMRIVGIDFRDGILFVPEVLLSANASASRRDRRRISWQSCDRHCQRRHS
jgi:methanogenic corrinoid protein MtbC1